MNDNRKMAIDVNMKSLIDTLSLEYTTFAAHLEINGVINGSERQLNQAEFKTDQHRVYQLLQLIKGKVGSWDILVEYLSNHGHADLVDLLRKSAGVEVDGDRSALSRFSSALAKFYKSPQSANIPSLWGDPKSVRDFWVPLKAEEKTKVFAKGERLDHAELLKCLADREDSDVALVIGDPGTGKTTLVKKITYEWAVNYESNPDGNQFKLVLSVPLRSVGKFDDFVKLAIGYFLETLQLGKKMALSGQDISDLNRLVNDLGSKLLVILDGLDEYNYYDQSLFKCLFAPKFSRSHKSIFKPDQLPPVYNKLIVTSRPYACEQINMEFLPLKFQLCLLDEVHLKKFVEIYCQTADAKVRVKKYIDSNSRSLSQVPLILTFICYLADSSKTEIPANLTLLYDNLVRQMLRREGKEEKLEEMINTLGQLAYRGCKDKKYSFPVKSLEKFHISNDSLISGFLLEKFDFADNRREVEFRHRSVQEFFAALYGYKQFLENNKYDIEIIRDIINDRYADGYCRFFFGICSKENKLMDMIEWISPCIIDLLETDKITRLADCSDAEQVQFGQYLYSNLVNYGEALIARWDRDIERIDLEGSKSFASGSNMISQYHDFRYWISDMKQTGTARLVVQKAFVPVMDRREWGFDRIENLLCFFERSHFLMLNLASPTSFLVPTRTLVFDFLKDLTDFTVTFVLQYSNDVVPLELRVIRVGYKHESFKELGEWFSIIDTKCITVTSKDYLHNMNGRHFYRLNVTVVKAVTQATLISSLVKFAVTQLTPSKDEKSATHSRKRCDIL